jgi:hypothetical protein
MDRRTLPLLWFALTTVAPKKSLVPIYVEDDALDEREATYESEEAPAGSDTE